MKHKHEVFYLFIRFKKYVDKMLNNPIKVLQCDEGGEYTKHTFQNYLANHGIIQRFSCPKHPELNGLAERKHRHLVETGIVLPSHASVSNTYWFDAFQTAIYLINRLPTRVLSNKSPFQTLFLRSPSYDMFKTFGCLCFPWLMSYTTNKLQHKPNHVSF